MNYGQNPGAPPAPQGNGFAGPPAPAMTPNQTYNPGPVQVIHSQEPSGFMPAPQFAPPQQPQQMQQHQPYGQPPAIVQQPHHAQQGYQYGQPAQPQYGQQPQGVPQGARPVAQGVYADQQGRMYGPGIPQELQGRTMQDALQAYGVMRQAAMQNVQVAGRPQQPQAQPQQPQRQVPQQPNQPQLPPQQYGQAPARSLFSDPDGYLDQKFSQMLDQKLGQYLGPVLEQTAAVQIDQARQQVAALFPQEFAMHEGEVMQKLQGLPPETLANPHAWRLALLQTVGEKALMASRGQPQSRPQQGGWQPAPQQGNGFQQMGYPQQSVGQMPPQQPYAQPQGWVPAGQQPVPPQGSFFSETPAAQGIDDQTAAGMLSPQQLQIAAKFGLRPSQYVQGMGVQYGQ
jgi:hypothetical protein